MWHIAPFDRGYCLGEDLANALAFAPCESARRCVHNADEIMFAIVAKRLVEHLERSGFCRHEEAADRRRRGARTGTRGLTRVKILASVTLQHAEGRRRCAVSERSMFQSCHGRPGQLGGRLA
jgi:hypothetical protein